MKKILRRPVFIVLIFMVVSMALSYTVSPIIAISLSQSELQATMISEIISYGIPLVVLLMLTQKDNETLFKIEDDFKKSNKNSIVKCMIHATLIFLISYLVHIIIELIQAKSQVIGIIDTIPFHLGQYILMIIGFALFPAIIEEILYKGILVKISVNKITRYFLVVIVFTMMHQGVGQIISAFIFSNITYFIYMKSKNLDIFISIHFIYNILSLTFTNYIILPIEIRALYENPNYLMYLNGYVLIGLSILSFVIGIYVFLNKAIQFEPYKTKLLIERNDRVYKIIIFSILVLTTINFLIINNI